GRVRRIRHMRGGSVSLPIDDAERFLHGFPPVVDQEHLGPLTGEEHGRRLSVSPAGADRARAGHDRNLPVEPQHVRCPLLSKVLPSRVSMPSASRKPPSSSTTLCPFYGLTPCGDWAMWHY